MERKDDYTIVQHIISTETLKALIDDAFERGRMSMMEQNSVVMPMELSKIAKVSLQTIRNWRDKKWLPAKNIAGGWSKHVIDDMISLSELEYKRKYKLL